MVFVSRSKEDCENVSLYKHSVKYVCLHAFILLEACSCLSQSSVSYFLNSNYPETISGLLTSLNSIIINFFLLKNKLTGNNIARVN